MQLPKGSTSATNLVGVLVEICSSSGNFMSFSITPQYAGLSEACLFERQLEHESIMVVFQAGTLGGGRAADESVASAEHAATGGRGNNRTSPDAGRDTGRNEHADIGADEHGDCYALTGADTHTFGLR
jgi:hypothetical protein